MLPGQTWKGAKISAEHVRKNELAGSSGWSPEGNSEIAGCPRARSHSAIDRGVPERNAMTTAFPLSRVVPFERVVLVLQGGGALGAYQAGVYQALHEAKIRGQLDLRHVDRRHQRRADRRQSA